MIRVLNFDKGNKHKMLVDWVKGTRIITWKNTYCPKIAQNNLVFWNPDILVIGGDVEINDDYPSLGLCAVLSGMNPKDMPFIFISTWSSDEARMLWNLLPRGKTFVCPFSETLANMIVRKAKDIKHP